MNVYDFDETIYDGDSTVDFYKFCLKAKPSIMFCFPLFSAVHFLIDRRYKLAFKERFYAFLKKFDEIDSMVCDFWDTHMDNIKPIYYELREKDDVVISASPEFLLEFPCKKLEISGLLASRVDKKTGKYTGLNCWGEEKVRRFREKYGDQSIYKFFTDSKSDEPLADIAERAYLVKGQKIYRWK